MTEAGTQKATRAALVHTWLSSLGETLRRERPDSSANEAAIGIEHLMKEGNSRLRSLTGPGIGVRVDVQAALKDLEDLDLIEKSHDGESITGVKCGTHAIDVLKKKWILLFDNK